MDKLILQAALQGGFVSLLGCLALVATKQWHGRFTLDSSVGVQKFHTAPTPRIGGIAIAIGLLVAWSALPTASPLTQLIVPMLLAGLPAFASGLAEDITKKVSVRSRLLATMASGLIASWLTGVSITRTDVPGFDPLLAWMPISFAFTAFAVSGVANAFNIIDGFNGLAAGTMLISLTALGLIAQNAGDPALAQLCLLIGAIVFGFMLVNFPFGKIFLGDGGAYLLGFLVAWAAVLLPMRNPQVSVWASLLACGYPVIEVLMSMWRKYRRDGYHPGQPDRVHLHMLLHSRLIKRLFPTASRTMKNGLTSIFPWAYASVPASIAVYQPKSTSTLFLGLLCSVFLYRLIYLRLTQFKWRFRAKRPDRSQFARLRNPQPDAS